MEKVIDYKLLEEKADAMREQIIENLKSMVNLSNIQEHTYNNVMEHIGSEWMAGNDLKKHETIRWMQHEVIDENHGSYSYMHFNHKLYGKDFFEGFVMTPNMHSDFFAHMKRFVTRVYDLAVYDDFEYDCVWFFATRCLDYVTDSICFYGSIETDNPLFTKAYEECMDDFNSTNYIGNDDIGTEYDCNSCRDGGCVHCEPNRFI